MDALRDRYGDALSPLVVGTRNEPWNSYVLIIGVTADFVRRIPLSAGVHYEAGSDEALVGEVAARRIGVEPGQTLSIDGRDVRVTGVFRTGSRLLDGGVMTDIAHAQRILTREGAERQYSLAVLRSGSARAARDLMGEVERDFPAFKAIPGTEFAGALRLLRVVDAFVKTLSVIAAVGTILVVSNTLLMSIAERTREIGILMTVGWTPWLVLRMLLAESLVLCAVGAAVGNMLALGLLRVVNGIESIGFGWIPVRFPLSLTGASFVLAFVVAVMAMLWPSVIVYRMQPLAAVRHE